MCGIFGAIRFRGFFDRGDFETFVGLTDMVDYRGPDGSGYLAVDADKAFRRDEARFTVFFGHRRLSIIDLSDAGLQPFTDDKGLWIIFNGEIFNYVELRDMLLAKGHSFKSGTDTEVILAVYREYGEEGFRLMNGMWAFAVLDSLRKRVVLSRDRFSIKPLYFTGTGETFFFASEIKQLLPLVPAKRVDEGLMYTFLNQGIAGHGSETFFKGIFSMEPKMNMIIATDGKMEKRKYWDYELEDVQDIEGAAERFRELFLDSMRIRLRSDVKVGALLSGGLDSSCIAIYADYLQNGDFETFSVVANDRRYSEERFIDVVVSEKGIRNTKLFFDPDMALRSLDDVICHNDEPIGGLSVVAQYAIFQKLRETTDITVVLSGQGGDESLMGYLKYFFFALKNLVKKGAFQSALSELLLSFFYRTVVWQFTMKEAKRYISFVDLSKKPFLRGKGFVEPIGRFSDLRQRQTLDIDKYSVPVLARYEDRNSMAHSLEVRLPFLDYRLVNFLVSLPTEYKVRRGWTKFILRQAVPELPERIRWRRDKQGFITSEEAWLKGSLRGIIESLLKRSVLDEMGFIDGRLFLRYYRDYRGGRGNISTFDIARVFLAELWVRRFFGGQENVTWEGGGG